MSFDPTKPATNTPTASAEIRVQLTALNTGLQTRATSAALNTAVGNAINATLPQTSSNTRCR